jgi:hypothetical protein
VLFALSSLFGALALHSKAEQEDQDTQGKERLRQAFNSAAVVALEGSVVQKPKKQHRSPGKLLFDL